MTLDLYTSQANSIFNSYTPLISSAGMCAPADILEAVDVASNQKKLSHHIPTSTATEHPLTLQLKKGSVSTDKRILKALTKKISQCLSSKTLWEKVHSEGPINLYLASKSTVPSFGFWEPITRSIAIERTLEPFDRKIQYLVFELCNAKSRSLQFMDDTRAGLLSKEDFLRKTYYYEYESLGCQHKVAKDCQKSNLWDSRIDLEPTFVENDQERENKFKKLYSHPNVAENNYAQANINSWNSVGRTPYCSKNPQAQDCVSN